MSKDIWVPFIQNWNSVNRRFHSISTSVHRITHPSYLEKWHLKYPLYSHGHCSGNPCKPAETNLPPMVISRWSHDMVEKSKHQQLLTTTFASCKLFVSGRVIRPSCHTIYSLVCSSCSSQKFTWPHSVTSRRVFFTHLWKNQIHCSLAINMIHEYSSAIQTYSIIIASALYTHVFHTFWTFHEPPHGKPLKRKTDHHTNKKQSNNMFSC